MGPVSTTEQTGQDMSTHTPIKTPALPPADPGRARVASQQHANMGGFATLTLYGTPEQPRLYASTPDAFSGVSVQPARADLVRFAREVLAYLGEDPGTGQLPPWRPVSSGTGSRPWYLCRYSGEDDPRVPGYDRYHFAGNGNLVRYASQDSAQRAADKLNAAEAGA